MPRLNDETVIQRLSRNKAGQNIFGKRKPGKVTDESTLLSAELQWNKNYAAILKAVGYSYRYISDTIEVQTGIVKRWFEDPEVQERVKAVQEDIVQGAVDHLQNYAVELVEMLMELARSTTDDSVKLKAIDSALDRVGVAKVSRSESQVTKHEKHEHDFSADVFEKMEGLPMETQEKLASMAAEMEGLITDARGKE